MAKKILINKFNNESLNLLENDRVLDFLNDDDIVELLNEPVPAINANEKFKIQQFKSKVYDKWYTECRFYNISLDFDAQDFIEANKNVDTFFSELCKKLTNKLHRNDKIRVIIFHSSLDNYMPISIPFIEVSQFESQLLSNAFLNVSQSKRELKIDKNIKIKSEIIRFPKGGSPSLDLYLETKKSIIKIKNNDFFCLLHAVVIAKELYDDKKANASRLNDNKNKKIVKNVELLAKMCDFNLNEPLSISQIPIIEDKLEDYQITVYDENYNFTSKPVYVGRPKFKFLYLFLVNSNNGTTIGHFHVIKSMKAFFNASYYCHFCKRKYEHKYKHNCDSICNICKLNDCKYVSGSFVCHKCNTKCKNERCLSNHCKYTCMKHQNCHFCNKMKSNKYHFCEQSDVYKYCANCKINVDLNHKCYISKESLRESKYKGFIFFDYESTQDKKEHIANLIIAMVYNNNHELLAEHIFRSNEQFCFWLFEQTNYIAFAHNMRAYDGMFIMHYISNNTTPDTQNAKILLQGYKFLKIEYKNVLVLDSYSFLPMPLSSFASTFNLTEPKGFFPHFFNTQLNQN